MKISAEKVTWKCFRISFVGVIDRMSLLLEGILLIYTRKQQIFVKTYSSLS